MLFDQLERVQGPIYIINTILKDIWCDTNDIIIVD